MGVGYVDKKDKTRRYGRYSFLYRWDLVSKREIFRIAKLDAIVFGELRCLLCNTSLPPPERHSKQDRLFTDDDYNAGHSETMKFLAHTDNSGYLND
jgi:hypothetical protein